MCVHQAGGIGKRNIVTCSGCRGETGPARGLLYSLWRWSVCVDFVGLERKSERDGVAEEMRADV